MPFADQMLGAEVVTALAGRLATAAPDRTFAKVEAAAADLARLGLRERADLVRDALLADLGGGHAALEALVRRALEDPAFTGWMIWPVTEAVAVTALADGGVAAFRSALGLQAALTPRLTAEFGIRALLDADLDEALPVVLGWTTHLDEHVRRLASEGTRPLLPWARRVRAILARPEATVPILDALHRDGSAYVRRSVANHLNDISRAHPELAVRTAARWSAADDSPATRQLVRHGLRTLIKKGNRPALALLGFSDPDHITVDGPRLGTDRVTIGGELRFSCTVRNDGSEAANLVIDYVVHHRKANGSRTPKVFKLTTRTLAPEEELTLELAHSFRLITTRVYHPGRHALEVQVNGASFGRAEFDLVRAEENSPADRG